MKVQCSFCEVTDGTGAPARSFVHRHFLAFVLLKTPFSLFNHSLCAVGLLESGVTTTIPNIQHKCVPTMSTVHLEYHCHPHRKPVHCRLKAAAAMTLAQGDVMLARGWGAWGVGLEQLNLTQPNWRASRLTINKDPSWCSPFCLPLSCVHVLCTSASKSSFHSLVQRGAPQPVSLPKERKNVASFQQKHLCFFCLVSTPCFK